MNCSQAQEKLFAADGLTEARMPADLASHLRACPGCQTLRLKLVRLEASARALPDLADDSGAKDRLLRQLQPRRIAAPALQSPLRLLLRRDWRPMAVAAAVLIFIAGSLWLGLLQHAQQLAQKPPLTDQVQPTLPTTGPGQPAESSLVDKLVDLNVDLADAATPTERSQIFAEQSAPITATLEQDHLAPQEKELASTLLANGKWLASNTDPLDEAERFDNVAGLLFDQLQEATPAGDSKIITRLTRRYGLVAERLEQARSKLAKASSLSPERKRRYENLVRRQSEVAQRLEDLLQRAPEMSRKEIRKELERVGKSGKRKHQTAK